MICFVIVMKKVLLSPTRFGPRKRIKEKNKQDGAHTKLRSMVNGIVDVTMLVSHLSSALQILDKGLELARQYSENNAI